MVGRIYYRLRHLLVSLAVLQVAVLPAIAAKEVDFAHRSLLVGKALLTVNLLNLAENGLGLGIVNIDNLRIEPIVLYQCDCLE